ncbi:hypothetical protein NLJ89_g10599 [Agrocybe chaxingu]|uniref:Uncharacterized protein n=1 Tax=Agrocybe chaxingu TaxID=84603 RepID=A0A9W8MRZ4_9AGAR|nr:hypothetical protein NLJ89_g10599 [Agrocybe chaxingu]
MSSGRPPITTRWTILDDSDKHIQYAGPWLDVDGAPFDNVGNFGPTYGGKMRATAAAKAAVSLKFNGANEDQFYVDRLGYGTANGTLLSDERVIQVDYTDSQIQYTGSSWVTFTMPRLPSSTYADQPDSSVSFSFNGSSIAWYAAVENGALNASRGNYQLDNEAPVPFDILGNFSSS